ncbi:MAG: hypothetical protein VB080_08530 [Propionicimonas sp.]|uniref:hypothetical protein n=1 Tax=Propionicimonas sp. TaxID=1955623 RepID=UPI002B1EA832|nr:hypothetical protein [Propionicimonas sp.]MEA4944469.1 hypothetical protein [Propionicimonas sp.]
MSLIVLTAAGHAPGVTTTALGLALTWPRPVLLVDADRLPTQAVLAGFLQGEDPFGSGLWAVLAAHREHRPLGPAVDHASLELPSADGLSRRFLPGFANPGMVDLFGTAWAEFATALAAREDDVLVDAGTIGAHGLPPALLAPADQVVVLTRSSLVDLAALRLYLPGLTEAVVADRLSLLIVGPGRPYSAAEIGAQFKVAACETIEWAPADAAVWSHGTPPRRGFASGGYVRSVRRASTALLGQLDRLTARIGAPR